jgi:hypothetical protein
LQAAGLFALAFLQVTVPPTAFSGLPLVAASSRASLQPATPGCRFNPCLNMASAKKNHLPATFFCHMKSNGHKVKF